MARQRGNSWQSDVIMNGRRVRHTFKTKAEAEAWESTARLAVERGLPAPSASSVTTGTRMITFINESIPFLWGGMASEMKMASCARATAEHFGPDRDIGTIDDVAIINWIESLKRAGNSNATINRKVSNLSKILKYARKKGLIKTVPDLDRLKEGTGRIRFLSEAEEATILQILSRWGQDAFVAYIKFLLYTGCRPSEAQRIEWRDITPKGVTFWHTKTSNPRTVPLVRQAREALAWTKEHGWQQPWSEISYFAFSKMWDKARHVMGLDLDAQFVPYALRHTCASRLVQKGVDIRRVKEWMGHTSIVMTMRYAHLSPTDLDNAAVLLEGTTVPSCDTGDVVKFGKHA